MCTFTNNFMFMIFVFEALLIIAYQEVPLVPWLSTAWVLAVLNGKLNESAEG